MDLGQVYEIPAWYRLGSTITSLPALSAIAALDPEDFPALPGQAAAFEDWALAHGWLTAVTVTDDVVVVTAGTVHSRPLPGNVIDPTLAQSSFTLTWTRRPGGKWVLFTRQCRADNRSWVWCTLGRVCRFIAQNPLVFELPAPEVTVREGGDGRLYFDGTLAENLQWVEDHLQEGEGVQEWQTVDREGSPLRIILLEEPWYEAGEGLVVEMPVVPQPA
jgi:hypothetical protein